MTMLIFNHSSSKICARVCSSSISLVEVACFVYKEIDRVISDIGNMAKPDEEANDKEHNQKSDKENWRLGKHCVFLATVIF